MSFTTLTTQLPRTILIAIVIISFITGLAAVPAIAQPADNLGPAVADEADVEFRLGNAAYVAGDYQRALGHYFSSYRLVPNRNVLFNVAKCYENLDQFVEAHRYYSLYLDGTAGAERDQVQQALARIGRRVGTLSVASQPPGASVYLDRKNLGEYARTPAEVVLKPGTYDVIVEREGWLPQIVKGVRIEPGKRVAHDVALIRREGNVKVRSVPRQVSVQVLPDGLEQVVDPDGAVTLPLGTQQVRISAPGYKPEVREVEVSSTETSVLTVELTPQTGQLSVQASEPGASIYVDGELVGFAPTVVAVPAGVHELVLRATGFEPYRTQVEVPVGERVEIEAALAGADEVAAASRVAESLRDAPASVSLIGSREIEAFRYRGTADALEGTRGIYFTNDLTYHSVGIRGYSPFSQFGNRTLVLIDGHAVNDSWIEASFHQHELTADLYGYERLELVRGPTSVLYGSGAFQGVISLVSPDIKDGFQSSRIGVSGAGDGVIKGYGHVRHVFGDGGVQASASTSQRQPHAFDSPARAAAAESSQLRSVGGSEVYTARLNAAWHDVSLYSFFHTRDKQVPTAAYETLFGDRRTRESDTRAFVDGRHRLALGTGVALENRVFVDYYGFLGDFAYARSEGGVSTDRFSGVWTGFESRLELEPFDRANWTVSLEGTRHLLHRTRSQNEDGPTVAVDAPFWKTALTTTFQLDVTNWMRLSAGARYDLWIFDELPAPDGGSDEGVVIQNANPRLVALLRPNDSSTLKLIGARGFRAPSVYELSYNDGGITQVASPGLSPESVWSAEMEFTQALWGEFDGVVAAYAQRIRSAIEVLGAGDETDPLRYENLGDGIWGGGLDLELRRPFFRGWMASAVVSYQRTRTGSFDVLFEPGDNVANSPRLAGALKLVAPIIARSLQLANRIVYQAGRLDRLGDPTLPVVNWDVVFSGEAGLAGLRWSLGVRNLLNWSIVHPVGDEIFDTRLPQPGRTLTADIAVTF